MSLALWGKEKRRKKNKQTRKKKRKRKKEEDKNNPQPLIPPWKAETPGALDRCVHWESQEANLLPRTVLSASVRITSYQRSGSRPGSSRINMCMERPKPRLNYWGGKCSEPQSATNTPPQLPAKTVFKFNILTLAGWNGWRAPVDSHDDYGISTQSSSSLLCEEKGNSTT